MNERKWNSNNDYSMSLVQFDGFLVLNIYTYKAVFINTGK